MRFLFVPALATVTLGLLAAPAAVAQSRIAVINFQRAVLDTAEFKKAYADLELRYKPRQEALAKANQELQDIETQARAASGQLSSSGAAELQARGQRKQVEVTRMNEDIQEDFTKDRDAALQLTSTRLGEVLKKLADEVMVDAFVDAGTVPFFRPAMDLTEKAIAAYDAAHPVK
jgi:outer membrane protein